MRCSGCETENPISSRFCSNCGKPLAQRCPRCNAEVVSNSRFCSQCGAPLIPASATSANPELPPVIPAADAAADGERRHLTVLFCDLAGSTALSASLDPEDWRATVAAYHRAAAEAINHFGGHVAKYLGDGVMAFFGYPEAHDNDAERAVCAGLAILDALAAFNESSAHPRLAARIGIDSGPVVVGTGAGPAADVFGDTPNIAARVQSAAEPDSVVVTAASHRLIHGLFVVEDRGAQSLKGLAEPLQLYRILRPSGARGRLEATATSRGLTPFVGREDELRLLASRWKRVLDGEGQAVLIIGEAGIGKSRLVQRFQEQIADTPHTWIEAGTGAFFQNTPFHPVSEMLRQFLGTAAGDPVSRLEPRLLAAGLKPEAALPLIAPLLNLPLPIKYPPSTLPPDQRRRRLLATLVEWVLGSARAQPLVIATEDLHWIDPSTLELIQLLVEQGAHARLLLLYTARPEFRPPWPLRAHHAQLTLNRLGVRDIRTMVAQVAASKALTAETIAAVIERTGGVPLFVEELTRAVLEGGDAHTTGYAIPATLHDSLMARLDRLGPAKEAIQIGAVLGSRFSYELLHAVHPIAEAELQRHLTALSEAELLYVRGLAPDATYQFKHALIRDAAYQALLKSRRRELHRSVAQTIHSQFPAIKESHPEVLARHWTEAGELEPAIAEWTRAGKSAESRNAFHEALENYQQAIACLQLLPESLKRDGEELSLRQSIVQMLQITKGWGSREAIAATEQGAALAEKTGDVKQIAHWLGSRSFAAWITSDLVTALDLADRTHELRLRLRNHTGLAHSHLMELMIRYWLGDIRTAEHFFVDGCSFFDDATFVGEPVGAVIAAFAYGAWTAWQLGRPELARERIARMNAVTDERNPHRAAFAGQHEAFLWAMMRECQRAESVAAHALETSQECQLVSAGARIKCILGEVRLQLGHPAEAAQLIRAGLSTFDQVGAPVGVSRFYAHLALAEALEGNVDHALATAGQAVATHPEMLGHRPEILDIRGQIHRMLGHRDLAEADFRDAIALAQKTGVKAWELRTTTSLARLFASADRRAEAYAMLSTSYNWFTEGFDTADLKDAKSLLADLSN